MSLLTPFFLLGLVGIGLPILLHRLQTQTNEREKFASSMFLEQARHRIHVKRKLKYLLLLAARILLLVLLVLAFTRPVWELPAQSLLGNDDIHHVIVIDSSFSMQQGEHFDNALDQARDIITSMNSGDQASLYTASDNISTIAESSADSSTLLPLVAGLEPNTGRLDIGVMISALNTLIPDSEASIRIHFISDMQSSGQPVRFADMIPDVINGRPVSLSLQNVSVGNQENWAITSVVAENNEARVTVQGFNTDEAERSVQLSINGEVQGELSQLVPAAGQQSYLFEDLIFETGDNRLSIELLENDGLSTDDRRYSVLDNSPPAPVLLLTSNVNSLSVTYISAALATAPRPYEAQVQDISTLDTRILERFAWVIVDDLGSVNPSLANAITDYMNAGGAVFAALGERSEALQTIPVSGHTLISSVNSTLNSGLNRNQGRRLITRIDDSHPVMKDSDGWATVNITQALPIDTLENDTVIMNLNDDIPLLIEQQIGLGSLLLLNSSLDNSWTDLPLKPVFVGFMAESARYLSGEDILIREQVVNSYLQLQASGGSSGQVYDPQGEALLTLGDTTQSRDVQLNQLGYYQVFTPNGEVVIAVNQDLRESDLTLMDALTTENWQNAVSGSSASPNANANSEEGALSNSLAVTQETAENQLEIWRVLLLLLVVIVLVESLLGNSYLRIKTDTPAEPATGTVS